ncbi:MAG: polyribonucleotide nucleotidyltransferase [Kiritimatiellia bacterium]|jgi:polyribonucleotide nucleotidyltransferase
MEGTIQVSTEVGGQTLVIETGLLARQAEGSVTVTLGENVVFSAVTCTATPREGIDYFPLQVEYRERFYACGRMPGGFFKREAKPSEKEVLTARLTDRPIRPLFPDGYRNDVQVNNTLFAADGVHEPDFLSVIAASAALHISEIPFMGPIGAVRVGRVNGRFIVNPTQQERQESDLDLLYSGTRDRFLMMEGGAKEIPEADFLAALKFGQETVAKIVAIQDELRAKLGKAPKNIVDGDNCRRDLLDAARAFAGAELAEALTIPGKLARQEAVSGVFAKIQEEIAKTFPETTAEEFRAMADALEIETVRKNVLEHGRRIDGRGFDEVRPLVGRVGVLPRVHGSALFSRGETQSLGVVTLGTSKDSQELDAVTGGPLEKRFYLHYNFPPYCTGEVGRLGSTGRREIGHGALAERALLPVIPENYDYTIRLVSEIMGSNGSSSMASICVGTLALMDAGVPIKKPVAGISCGLFTAKDGSKAVLVTDILGAEDHCGDMDFKIGGTRDGITGFQVDLKIRGLTWDLVEQALERDRVARIQILDYMETVLPAPRAELAPTAPRIQTVQVNPEKIGALIGPGGKNIRGICALTGAQIDIAEDDSGKVFVFATSKEAMDAAIREINRSCAEPEEGMIYEGRVTGVKAFGAFVEILPGIDGLCHISELSDSRVPSVEAVCKEGDRMWVKCIGVDDRGKIKLSRREAMRERDRQAAAEAGDAQ